MKKDRDVQVQAVFSIVQSEVLSALGGLAV
jgi:hypothetical protein